MWYLRFLVNSIILIVYFVCISAGPTKSSLDQVDSSTDLTTGFGSTEGPDCPCLRNESAIPVHGRLDSTSRDHQFADTHTHNVLVHGMVCSCNLGVRGMQARDDYRYTPGIGSHKLHTRAVVWNVARKLCNDEGGHLAIINSIAEAHILMDIFNRSGPVKGAPYPEEAFVGIHDLYSEGDWVTVLGDSLAKTGYTGWSDKWGGQPDNGGGRQNCGAFMKEGGLDDVACEVPFPFFCEIPLMRLL